jgi:uncharacterized protein (DUF2141 family)
VKQKPPAPNWLTAIKAGAAGALVVSSAALADLSNKWRLEFSGDAESSGEILFRVTPQGGVPIDAVVTIQNESDENEIAQAVTLGLQAQLPPEAYRIERDDGEDVLVKKLEGAADFGLAIASNTVVGVRINLDRE